MMCIVGESECVMVCISTVGNHLNLFKHLLVLNNYQGGKAYSIRDKIISKRWVEDKLCTSGKLFYRPR